MINTAFGLEVLHPRFSWSRCMLVALKHFVQHRKSLTIEMQMRGHRDELIDMEQSFRHVILAHTECRESSRKDRSEKDGMRIEVQPDRASVKCAPRHTMRDITFLKAATTGQTYLILEQRAAANTLTLAMIFHNGKAGRCVEWMSVKYQVTRQRPFKEHSDYLVARDHKRTKQRGYFVKVLATKTRLKRNTPVKGP